MERSLQSLHHHYTTDCMEHNCMEHNCMEHNCMEHNFMEHNCMEHNCMEHNFMEHNCMEHHCMEHNCSLQLFACVKINYFHCHCHCHYYNHQACCTPGCPTWGVHPLLSPEHIPCGGIDNNNTKS